MSSIFPISKGENNKCHWGMKISIADDKISPLCQGIMGILSTPPYTKCEEDAKADCQSCAAVLSGMIRKGRVKCPDGFTPIDIRKQTGGRLRRVKMDFEGV